MEGRTLRGRPILGGRGVGGQPFSRRERLKWKERLLVEGETNIGRVKPLAVGGWGL